MSAVPSIDIYIGGMSNVDAIRSALPKHESETKIKIARLNTWDEHGGFYRMKFEPEKFRDDVARSRFVALSLWGNWYNSVALVDHPEPFDFIYPSFDEAVDPSRRIIPFHQIRHAFASNVRFQLRMLDQFRAMTEAAMVLLEPPPPIESHEHIATHPGPFGEEIAKHGITPAAIRRKLWKLQSAIYGSAAEELRVTFLPFPERAMSPSGFLAPDYCYPYPTHANERYGSIMLLKLEELFKAVR